MNFKYCINREITDIFEIFKIFIKTKKFDFIQYAFKSPKINENINKDFALLL